MPALLECPDCPRSEKVAVKISLLPEPMHCLRSLDYKFVTPMASARGRVAGRPGNRQAQAARDILRCAIPFETELLPPTITGFLDRAEASSHRAERMAAAGHVVTRLPSEFSQ